MTARTSVTHPIRVDWIATGLPGKVGLTFAPGKHSTSLYSAGTWARDLATDLDDLVLGCRVLARAVELLLAG